MGDDMRLPRVGELVALQLVGPRLLVGRVVSAHDKAMSLDFRAVASRPAELEVPEPSEQVHLSGIAGTPVDAHGTCAATTMASCCRGT